MLGFLRRNGPAEASGGHAQGSGGHLIELRRVVKAYESAAGAFLALRGVDLQVDRGELVA